MVDWLIAFSDKKGESHNTENTALANTMLFLSRDLGSLELHCKNVLIPMPFILLRIAVNL